MDPAEPKPPAYVPAGGNFATTHWSIVLAAGQVDAAASADALETLCGTYWYPLYAYVRRVGYDEETAKDLTQSFFERLLAGHYLKGVAPGKGRFRSFLLAALKHFLANEWDRQRTVRRGGRYIVVSFDQAWMELCQRQDAGLVAEPERIYERRWALAVLEAVKARLAAHYAASGRSRLFEALQGYLSAEDNPAPYQEVASRLGVSVDVIKKSVERMRHRYGEFLREEIAQTVSHQAEIDDELRYLRKVLAG